MLSTPKMRATEVLFLVHPPALFNPRIRNPSIGKPFCGPVLGMVVREELDVTRRGALEVVSWPHPRSRRFSGHVIAP